MALLLVYRLNSVAFQLNCTNSSNSSQFLSTDSGLLHITESNALDYCVKSALVQELFPVIMIFSRAGVLTRTARRCISAMDRLKVECIVGEVTPTAEK